MATISALHAVFSLTHNKCKNLTLYNGQTLKVNSNLLAILHRTLLGTYFAQITHSWKVFFLLPWQPHTCPCWPNEKCAKNREFQTAITSERTTLSKNFKMFRNLPNTYFATIIMRVVEMLTVTMETGIKIWIFSHFQKNGILFIIFKFQYLCRHLS